MTQLGINWFLFFMSFFSAAVLELTVLPDKILFLRPEWVVLTLIYWLLRFPEKIGITTGCFIGLIIDVLSGTYLGVHMLSLSIVCYLTLTMHKRLKMFPIAQQSVVIFFIVGIQLMVVYTLRSTLGGSGVGLSYLWQAFTSALIWPLMLVILDRLFYSLR